VLNDKSEESNENENFGGSDFEEGGDELAETPTTEEPDTVLFIFYQSKRFSPLPNAPISSTSI
jgi:hypothetical protein